METARAGAPEMDPVGTALVGPLLIAAGSRAQQAQLLPEIREARVRWCVALFPGLDPGLASGLAADPGASEATSRAGGAFDLCLSGTLEAVPGAAVAQRLLCAVGSDRLCLIDLTRPGVDRRTLTGLDGATDSATLTLDALAIDADRWLEIGADEALDRVAAIPGAWPLQAFRQRARLDALRAAAAQFVDADTTLLESPEFTVRLGQIEIDLLGLEALERRALAGQARGAWTPARAALVRVRQVELERALGVLTRDVLGYYSLPFPDSRLIDNEGPIGHDGALALVAQALARPGTPLDDVTGDYHHNTIARSLLGP